MTGSLSVHRWKAPWGYWPGKKPKTPEGMCVCCGLWLLRGRGLLHLSSYRPCMECLCPQLTEKPKTWKLSRSYCALLRESYLTGDWQYETLATNTTPFPYRLHEEEPTFALHFCKNVRNLTRLDVATPGTSPFLGMGTRLCGQEAGVTRQAGGGSWAQRHVWSKCCSPAGAGWTKHGLIPPHLPSVQKQWGFSVLGLMTATQLKSPVTSLVPGNLKDKHIFLSSP